MDGTLRNILKDRTASCIGVQTLDCGPRQRKRTWGLPPGVVGMGSDKLSTSDTSESEFVPCGTHASSTSLSRRMSIVKLKFTFSFFFFLATPPTLTTTSQSSAEGRLADTNGDKSVGTVWSVSVTMMTFGNNCLSEKYSDRWMDEWMDEWCSSNRCKRWFWLNKKLIRRWFTFFSREKKLISFFSTWIRFTEKKMFKFSPENPIFF